MGPAYSYWSDYVHPRSSYQFPVPPGVRSVGSPGESAETAFQSSDGDFLISAWGGAGDRSASSMLEEQWAAAQRRPGRTVTYRKRSNSWFVVSGTERDGTEFYEKMISRGNQVAAFTLTYPRSRLREFEPWVEKIEDGFRIVSETSRVTTPRMASPTVDVRPPAARQSRNEETRLAAPARPPRNAARSRVSTPERAPARKDVASSRYSREIPPPPRENPDLEPEAVDSSPRSTTELPAQSKEEGATRKFAGKQMPVGSKVIGKPGFVYSPFVSDKSLVDVVGIPSGTKVKCPYSSQIFLVP